MGNITFVDIAIILFYMLLITLYGLWKAKSVKNSEDFLVAGRGLGTFVLIGTLVMTEFNTATFIGYSIFSYAGGLFAVLIALDSFFGLGAYTLIVSKRWNRLRAVSITEMFDQRYDSKLRLVASLMVISTLTLFCTAYLKAASLVFSMVLNLNMVWTVIIISAIVLVFTLAGGLISVSWTNLISFVMTLFILPLILYISYNQAGELGGLSSVFASEYLSFNIIEMWDNPVISFETIITIYVLVFLVYMQSPWYAQLMFAAKNEKTAYLGMGFATLLVVFFYAMSMLIAAYARVGFPDLADPQFAIPAVITTWMPVGIKGLTLALVLSVCQSTMSSIWNNNASIITQDIYKEFINPNASDKKILKVTRLLVLFLAVFTMVVSIFFVNLIIDIIFSANIFMVALFFPVLGGFLFWKVGERAVWVTIVLGTFSGWAIYFLKNYANNALPVYLQNHDWLFLFCCIFYPVIILIGIIISFFENPNEDYLIKKIAFYDKVGAPWFGKEEYFSTREELMKKGLI